MTAELPRPLPLTKIVPEGLTIAVTASPAECQALAARMGIPAVHTLTCVFRLIPAAASPGRFRVDGVLDARVTRECVVSTEQFETPVHDVFDAMFVPEDEVREELGPDDIDEIPYSGGTIDLGEAAAEQLALALDPYPRIDGAAMPDFDGEDTGPFAALARRRTDGTE